MGAAPDLPHAVGARESKTILLVEDEEFVRNVTAEVLAAAGYQVLKAENAQQALYHYGRYEGQIDLLLTDVCMPGKSGRVLARELHALCPRIKVIFISGYGDVNEAGEDCRAGSVFHLPKPFAVRTLITTVEEALAEVEVVPAGKALAAAAH